MPIYDRRAAVEYARRWALGRNPAYYDFTALGGDCTSFASQCLFAGAGVMNDTPVTGWYYRSANDRTASWTGVEFLYRFLTENAGPGPSAAEVSRERCRIGDLIQLGRERFYHTLVIVQTEPELLVCTHTVDSLNRPLASYDYDRARFLHVHDTVEIRSLPKPPARS